MYRKPYRIKKKKSIFRTRFFWLFVLTLIFLGGIFYLIFLSPFFQIREIKISGAASFNEKVSNEEIQAIIEKKINQRILFFPIKNIFLANLNQMQEEILKEFPQIAQVNLKRKFFHVLEIKIEERKPIAIFYFEEVYFFIDKEGVIFEEISKNEFTFFKIKNLILKEKPKLGESVIEKESVSKILKIASESENLKVSPKEFVIVSDDKIDVKTQEDWEIYFDPQKDLDWQFAKLKVDLENVIPPEKRKDLEYIDLRFGDFAPFKYRAGAR